jgi:RNA polymerase subunit RPABC4/transcription elongation factor Spt4
MSREVKNLLCKNCGAPLDKKAKCCPNCGEKNKKPLYTRWWFILLVVLVVVRVISSVGGSGKKEEKVFDWNTLVLCDVVPAPESNKGEIHTNTETKARISVSDVSDEEYRTYLNQCKEYGFTVEGESDSYGYDAYNADGYKLSLTRYSSGDLTITITAPMELGTLQWPKSDLAALIPMPESDVGKVTSDSSNGFSLYVGQMSQEDFSEYTDACYDAGFSVDYSRGDTYFRAYDLDGNYLSVSYEGNSVISIEVKAPEETQEEVPEEEDESVEKPEEVVEAVETAEEPIPEEPALEESAPAEQLVDGMRPSFKEAVDTYEQFFNDYCDFMVRYNDSDDTLGMLSDYLNYIASYVDMMDALDELGDEDMNDAEALYYAAATLRIEQNLLDVAQSIG